MEVLIVPVALVLLAFAARRFGHDSRDAFAPIEDIRSDLGYREEADLEPAIPAPVRPAQPPRLADAHP